MMSDSSASLWQLGPGTHELLHNHHHTACHTNAQTPHYKSAAVTHKGNAPAITQQQEQGRFVQEVSLPAQSVLEWFLFSLLHAH